jgi:O-antigen/teichoic acid export membrane protein
MIGRYMSKRDFLRETQPVQTKINREQMFVVYRNLWPMAWRQGVVMIGAFLIQRGNTLVCSAKLGLSETASYGLTLNIINVILVTALMPLSLSWPTISRMRVQRDSAGIRRLFFKRLYLGLAVAACGIVFLALVGPWGLAWLGSDTKLLPAGVILVLGLVYLLEQHHSNYAILVLTENQNPFLIPGLLSGIAIIIFAWFIGGNYGVIGIILVQGLIQLLWNNWWTVVRGIKSL